MFNTKQLINCLKGFGEFKDEAEVAFWTGILGVFIQYFSLLCLC